jgi:hypothetical protein
MSRRRVNARQQSGRCGDRQLFQLHNDGSIWRSLGNGCSGSSCPNWKELDNNHATKAIVAGSGLYQMHTDGSLWRYTGAQCSGASCPGWWPLDNNGATRDFATGGVH